MAKSKWLTEEGEEEVKKKISELDNELNKAFRNGMFNYFSILNIKKKQLEWVLNDGKK